MISSSAAALVQFAIMLGFARDSAIILFNVIFALIICLPALFRLISSKRRLGVMISF